MVCTQGSDLGTLTFSTPLRNTFFGISNKACFSWGFSNRGVINTYFSRETLFLWWNLFPQGEFVK